MTESTDISHSHAQDHRDFLQSLRVPHQLGKDGRIRTIRKLDKRPPLALVPHNILKLKRDYDQGVFAGDTARLLDVRKRLRRYHLVPEHVRVKQTKADRSAYYKQWRARNPGYGRAAALGVVR